MKLLLALVAAAGAVSANAAEVTPVQKVIQLMTGMLAKGQADMAEEAKIYKEYSDWVHDQDRDTKLEIGDLKSKIEKLEAIEQKAEADMDAFAAELSDLNVALGGFESELSAATAERAEEKAAFDANEKDLGESVDALDRAIGVMKSRQYNVDQPGESLLQVAKRELPAKVGAELMAFVQMQQPQGKQYAYEFQGGGIVDLLKKLKKTFAKELYDAQTAESNGAHNFQLMKMNLEDEIKNAKSTISDRQQKKSQAEATAADAKRQLVDSNADLAASEKYLSDMHTTFTLKSGAFEQNQTVRTEELKALSTAVDIISGGSVSGSADKYLPALVQEAPKKAKATSFLQIRQKTLSKARAMDVMHQVSQMLQERNAEFGNKSKFLSLAAFKIMSGATSASGTKGPFDKIIGMIEDMLARLGEEAAAEAEHKKFCDAELKDNKLTREAKTSEVDSMTAQSNEYKSTIAQLADEVAKLDAAEAALNKAMAEATEQRNAEKAKATETVADAKAAQEALTQALGVLREFYSSQGALMQTEQVPEMKAYAGQQAAKGGVVGMLEVIQSDFARLEADTSATETQAQMEYDQFMEDATADAKAKHQDSFDKSLYKDQTEHKLHMLSKDLKDTRAELDAAQDYHMQLKGACVVQKVSYEERVRMREEEISSLREALEILEGESD